MGEGPKTASRASNALFVQVLPDTGGDNMLTAEVDCNRVDWKKWVLGPYKVLL